MKKQNLSFCWRCICAKIEKEVEAEWQDIIEFFNLPLHRDSLRKAVNVGEFSAYNIYKYMEDKIANMVIDSQPQQAQDELLMELEMKKIELYKERVKLRDERNERNKFYTVEARWKILLNYLKSM